jgi:hypothetical protein
VADSFLAIHIEPWRDVVDQTVSRSNQFLLWLRKLNGLRLEM